MPEQKIIFVVIFFPAVFFLTPVKACAEETDLSNSTLRQKVEFIGQDLRDPFESYIKEEKKVILPAAIEEEQVTLPPLSLQGMIWGGRVPCAIINGRVLKQGDTIDGVEIDKIAKEGVCLLYRGRKYNLAPPSRPGMRQDVSGGRNEK